MICVIHGADGYQWAIPVGDKAYLKIWATLNRRMGQRVGADWVPPRVYLFEGDEPPPLQRADMPWFAGGALVVTRHAREVLAEVLDDDAEMLPLLHDGEDLWLVNPWRQVDALDEENSEFKRFRSTGRLMRVVRYAFREDVIKGIKCFTIPQLENVMFVDSSVGEAVQRAGLTGVAFSPVYS